MDDKIIPLELPGTVHEKAPEPASSAAKMLRAFEDEHLGKAVPRINGAIERGHGSAFQNMRRDRPHIGAHHAALERLVKAEQAVNEAASALAAAKVEHEAAGKAVDSHAKPSK